METQETQKRSGWLFRRKKKETEVEITDPPLYHLIPEGKCRNCGTDISSKFCPECGQKAGTKRFTLRSCLNNLFTALLNLDNSSIRTFRILFTHPDQIMKEYICGRRISYMNPFNLVFVLLLLGGLIVGVMGGAIGYAIFKTVFELNKTFFEISYITGILFFSVFILLPLYFIFRKRIKRLMKWVQVKLKEQ